MIYNNPEGCQMEMNRNWKPIINDDQTTGTWNCSELKPNIVDHTLEMNATATGVWDGSDSKLNIDD